MRKFKNETVTIQANKSVDRLALEISPEEIEEGARLESICFELDSEIAKALGIPSYKFDTFVTETQISIRNIKKEGLSFVKVNITPLEGFLHVTAVQFKSIIAKTKLPFGSSPRAIASKVADTVSKANIV